VTFDGVTAVQARIAQIQQLVTETVSGVGSTTAPGATSTSNSTATGATAPSPEFASLLADAMATDTTASDPFSDSSSSGSDASIGGTSTLSQLLQLSQLGSGAASGATSGSSLVSGLAGGTGTSLDSLLSGISGTGLTGVAPTLGVTAANPATTNPTTQAFLTNALSQQGKPYVYGATAQINDPNPPAFDCSELTKWAAARAGDPIPDGATAQYLYIRDHGGTMSVQQALHTPGALLFHFSHEPKNLGDIPADGHVAISLGDGVHTIEARGHAYGTNVFDNASGRDFDFAGMIPGMS
jgi:cell wall-associated NlpC family hydrolase